MLRILQISTNFLIVPSPIVDLVWHAHILDTHAYARDCDQLFGRFIHHAPNFGGKGEKEQLLEQYVEMLEIYEQLYGTPPDQIWQISKKRQNDGPGNCCNGEGNGCAGCGGNCGYNRYHCPWCQPYVPIGE